MSGDPVTFYCTRCGKQLQIGHELAGQRVRGGHCSNVVGSPKPEPDIPVAFVVETDASAQLLDDDAIASLLGLEAAWDGLKPPAEPPTGPIPAIKLPDGQTIDALAEQLQHVQVPAASDPSGMADCPHCGVRRPVPVLPASAARVVRYDQRREPAG